MYFNIEERKYGVNVEVARVWVEWEKNLLSWWFDKNICWSKKHEIWYLNTPTELILCRSCYRHFVWRKWPYMIRRRNEKAGRSLSFLILIGIGIKKV